MSESAIHIPEQFLGPAMHAALEGIPDIHHYYSPSQIQEKLLKQVIHGRKTPEMSAWFEDREGRYGTYTTFNLLNLEAEEDAKTVAFFDHTHTNELASGTATTELTIAAANNPALLNELGAKKLVYYDQYPDEVSLNRGFLYGNFEAEDYLKRYFKGAYRSAINPDWGYPSEVGGRARFPATQNAMDIMDEEADMVVPLHNAGIGGAYILSNCSKETAQVIADFLQQQDFRLSPPEPLLAEQAREIVHPVYDITGVKFEDGYEHEHSSTYTKMLGADYFIAELPYFQIKGDEVDSVHLADIKARLWSVDNFIYNWRKWGDRPCLPETVLRFSEHLAEYKWPEPKSGEEIEEYIPGDVSSTDYYQAILKSLFYKSLALGHAWKAGKELLKFTSDSELGQFVEDAQLAIDKSAEAIAPHVDPTDRTHHVKTIMGVICLGIARP